MQDRSDPNGVEEVIDLAHSVGAVYYADRKAMREGRVVEVCARLEERIRARVWIVTVIVVVYILWGVAAITEFDEPPPLRKLLATAFKLFVLAPALLLWFRRKHNRIADRLGTVASILVAPQRETRIENEV